MPEDVKSFSMDNTCRTCLGVFNADALEPISLFDDVFIHDKSVVTIKDVLNSTCCLRISQNDGLPEGICTNCMEKVKDVFVFRMQCENSDKTLRQCVTNNKNGTACALVNDRFARKYTILDCIVDEITLNDNATLLVVEDCMNNEQNNAEDKCAINKNVNELEYVDSNVIESYEEDEDIPLQRLAEKTRNGKSQESVSRSKKMFQCDDCDITFTWRVKYNEHMRKFHKITRTRKSALPTSAAAKRSSRDPLPDSAAATLPAPVACHHCGDTFATRSELELHSSRLHDEEPDNPSSDTKSFSCAACNKTFRNADNLAKHHRRQHLNDHVCEVCDKRFDNRRKLRLHKTCHTAESEKRYRCAHCDKRFNQVHHLQNHERVHTGQKPYLCSACGKGFRQQYALTLHSRTHSDTRPYVCSECGKSFSRKQGLDAHRRCHGDHSNHQYGGCQQNGAGGGMYMCSECGIRLSRLRTLDRHVWQVHGKGDDPDRNNPDLSPDSNRKSTTTTNDTGSASGAIGDINETTAGYKKAITYSCNVCSITFEASQSLRQHMRTHALQHVCGVCSKAFMLPNQLVSHMRQHAGAKSHACQHPGCGRVFNRPEHVRSHHIRAHTTERPHRCDVCMKGFCQSGDLKVHMRYHTGERPYTCPVCCRAFAASSGLRGHLRRHTGDKPYRCAVCQRGYYTSTELNLHMRCHTSKTVEISKAVEQAKVEKTITLMTGDEPMM